MTNPHCECPLAGYCPRHKMEKNETLRTLCLGEGKSRDGGLLYWRAWEKGKLGATAPEVAIMDPEGFNRTVLTPSSSCCGGGSPEQKVALLAKAEEVRKFKIAQRASAGIKQPEVNLSSIGTLLKGIIFEKTGNDVPCSECLEEILRLNKMTSDEVRGEITELAFRIVSRSSSNAQRWYHRLAATLLPEFVAGRVQEWIKLACLMNDNEMKTSSLRWEYGITTVKSRSKDLFPRTLESLMNAGFDTPRVFVDGCTPSESDSIYKPYNLPLTIRDNVRTAGNWVLSMYELYIRNPSAERYAIFQDDFVTVRNLRRYLELSPYPSEGYQNLYTFPSNQSIAPKDHQGWYPANQLGKGAVALVFSNEAVRTLLGQNYLVDRFQSNTRGHKAIDGGIVESMKAKGWKEYVHTPSLTQHTGDVSSMGNSTHLKAISFPGENFNALDWLK